MPALDLTSSPLVSVLLPAFNAASTILPAIRSILDGDYPNLECIVVDDGSDDDTFRAAKSIQDSRLRIIRQAHQGVAHAHNRAVREARGTWLARMDADDIATPNRLSVQWRFLQEQGCGLIGGGVSIVDMEGKPVKSMKRYQDWLNRLNDHASIMAQRFVELPIVNPTLFGHRKWFERGCVQGPFPEDYDFFLNVTQDPSLKTGKVDETILFWRDHPE
ncbi:MAG: glycosyltransferase family A protein, partial [Verrucomicrobiales bacterium]